MLMRCAASLIGGRSCLARARAGLLATLAALLAVGAASARAGTIAYVNGSDNNVYVADPSGADVHEVAVGLASPALDRFGDLYALDGTQVDVFTPGVGARASIATGAAAPTQLAVSPYGARFAVTDGTPLSGATTLDVISRSGGLITSVVNGFGPYWSGPFDLTGSVLSTTASPPVFNHVILYDGLFSQALWYPDFGFTAPGFAAALEYAPNPQHTEAAAVVFEAVAAHLVVGLELFPINSALRPSGGNPVLTDAACEIGDGDFSLSPGSSFAWSPNGRRIAFSTVKGIATATIGSTFSGDCSQVGAEQLVVRHGYDPAWGPSSNRDFPAPEAK